MNYLDLYLQNNNCKRCDVESRTSISHKLLSSHASLPIEDYSNLVIMAIADTIGKSPGQVLTELLELEDNAPLFKASSAKELMEGLKRKEDVIIIKGEYYKNIYELLKGQLSETELMGFELGSSGIIPIIGDIIVSIRDFFKPEPNSDKENREIERRLKHYKVQKITEEKIVLRLKQLDY
ncbi:MAG: XRE family transcriptional regulator [Romboutsia sp.]